MSLTQIALELALGLGVALCGANLMVLAQETRRRKGGTRARRSRSAPPSMSRVWVGIVAGAVVAAWAAVRLLARN